MALFPFSTTFQIQESDLIAAERFMRMADLVVVADTELDRFGPVLRPDLEHLMVPVGAARDKLAGIGAVAAPRLPVVYASHEALDGLMALLDTLDVRLVLVSGSSDMSIVGTHLRHLDTGRIVQWFGQNVSVPHDRLTPIPIGLASRLLPHGDPAAVITTAVAPVQRRHLFYLNLRVSHPDRIPIARRFLDMGSGLKSGSKDFAAYLADIRSCLFCVSPPGNGLDCHRTWEALYMGTVPIVVDGPWLSSFRDLPMLPVSDWQALTEQALIEAFQSIRQRRYDYRLLSFRHWQTLIFARAEQG